MSGNQYPSDVQFASLMQAATAAADAQELTTSSLGKRQRTEDDDSVIDTQLRVQSNGISQNAGQLPPTNPVLPASASVLFREPSEKSKKYSRPPLGKVFIDLQLAPESFLRLQNAAKEYMLDENHPERRDVVGHKKHSSNHNDVAKLRLFNCVEEFLTRDNNGETWFGHSAGTAGPDAPPRTFFWPEDRPKITKACMPLFRKMVTNERQRIYASETRKQDSNKGEKKTPDANLPQHANEPSPPSLPNNGFSVIDQTLDSLHTNQDLYSINNPQQQHQSVEPADHLMLHVNIVSNNDEIFRRVVPKIKVSAENLNTLPALIAEIRKTYDILAYGPMTPEEDGFTPVVKVLLPKGMVRIKDDDQWMMALLTLSMTDWMDSEVRVLIEINDPARIGGE